MHDAAHSVAQQRRRATRSTCRTNASSVGLDAYQTGDCKLRPRAPGDAAGLPSDASAAAVTARKHIFTEKPVAVDGPGIRTVLAAEEEANRNSLTVVAGTQRRYQTGYLESMARIRDGAIGTITVGPLLLEHGRSLASRPATQGMTDLEWQIRNWLYFTWLSGDHICRAARPQPRRRQLGHRRPPNPRRRHGRPPGAHRPASSATSSTTSPSITNTPTAST